MKTTKIILKFAVAISAVGYFGLLPMSEAVSPPPDGGYSGGNTAEGQNALFSLTTGGYNTAIGFLSLKSNATNSFNTALGAGTLLANTADDNTAVGAGALLSNTTGSDNTANGVFALLSNTSGFDNTAVGVNTLHDNSAGFDNTANGTGALEANTAGSENTAVGVAALESNTEGEQNTAMGVTALLNNISGDMNTGLGYQALIGAHGNGNTAVGAGAGINLVLGDNNIDIGNPGAEESNTIRIGNFTHTAVYIGGIAGDTVGAGGTTCYVDNDGKLGVFLSARRYKQNIQPMDDASAALYALKPVTFRYKPQFDRSSTPQFGLVAEDVAAVNSDLVVRDAKGEISTVRYEAINVMLLNEFLKAHKIVQEQGATIAELKSEIAALTTALDDQAAKIREVSVHIGTIKREPERAAAGD